MSHFLIVKSGTPGVESGGPAQLSGDLDAQKRELSHLLIQKWDTGALKSGYISPF